MSDSAKWAVVSMAPWCCSAPWMQAHSSRPQRPHPALSFDIPAQPLADALAEFGRNRAGKSPTRPAWPGLRSTAIAGTHDPAAALGLLLSGTGITWRGSGERRRSGEVERRGRSRRARRRDARSGAGRRPAAHAAHRHDRHRAAGLHWRDGGARCPRRRARQSRLHEHALQHQQLHREDDRGPAGGDGGRRRPQRRFGPLRGPDRRHPRRLLIRGLPSAKEPPARSPSTAIYGVAPNYRLFTGLHRARRDPERPGGVPLRQSPASSIGGTVKRVPKRAGDVDLTRFTADYASI